MVMSRGYFSRRIAETMRSARPVETPDTDASKVFSQFWRRRDGKSTRQIDVLALDEQMAEELGGVRLVEKFGESLMNWKIERNRQIERLTSKVWAILGEEDPDEAQIRADRFAEFEESTGAGV